MSNIITLLKSNGIKLPIWIGQAISHIPFEWRPVIGNSYLHSMKDISSFDKMSIDQKQNYIFKRMYKLVEYAINNIDFYKDFYAQKNFSIAQLRNFEDIKRIPIICKEDLAKYPLEYRSAKNVEKYIQNTGGSSGQTLSFYVQPEQFGCEWAHIHTMWKELGFRPSDLRLLMVGRNNVKDGVEYEFARHTLSLDIYQPFRDTASKLKQIIQKHPVLYLHGYPSVMSDFALYCQQDPKLLALLKGKLRGAFLNSEYPYSKYRETIEHTFNIKTQSFYGHTERCVMAYEKHKHFRYIPFQTYGYAEAIKREDGHYDLIGTSYNNLASPLIRYNTKDIIDNPSFNDGIMSEFDIIEGRSGQYIIDKNGQRISLTALVMGRHHTLFDLCKHIQIGQLSHGTAIVFYEPHYGVQIDNVELMFDASNVDIDFKFEKVNSPLRTSSGKVNLLVLPSLIDGYFQHLL